MEGPPDLAVEVISPSSIDVDRADKFTQYREAGVAHYWINDPALKTIETWKLEGGQYLVADRGRGAVTVKLAPFADLEIPLAKLWRA
ncbi:MAG: hypothetical protein JWL69_3742 [Phycisphaerales bacterium]|nr:hypothetical protein [Phycisphaerales bacterium]MDB5358084.1 hypothetical protein [Phycisphaerales bacterium]